MNILIARRRLLAVCQSCRNRVEAALDLAALREREHGGVIQRHCPRLRELDIEWPESEIDSDGVIQRVELRGGTGIEASTPELVRHRGRRRGRHAICSVGLPDTASSASSGAVTLASLDAAAARPIS